MKSAVQWFSLLVESGNSGACECKICKKQDYVIDILPDPLSVASLFRLLDETVKARFLAGTFYLLGLPRSQSLVSQLSRSADLVPKTPQ